MTHKYTCNKFTINMQKRFTLLIHFIIIINKATIKKVFIRTGLNI